MSFQHVIKKGLQTHAVLSHDHMQNCSLQPYVLKNKATNQSRSSPVRIKKGTRSILSKKYGNFPKKRQLINELRQESNSCTSENREKQYDPQKIQTKSDKTKTDNFTTYFGYQLWKRPVFVHQRRTQEINKKLQCVFPLGSEGSLPRSH